MSSSDAGLLTRERTARRVVLVEQALDRASLTTAERELSAAELKSELRGVRRVGEDAGRELILAVRSEALAADDSVEVRARLDRRVLVGVLETTIALGSGHVLFFLSADSLAAVRVRI